MLWSGPTRPAPAATGEGEPNPKRAKSDSLPAATVAAHVVARAHDPDLPKATATPLAQALRPAGGKRAREALTNSAMTDDERKVKMLNMHRKQGTLRASSR